MIAEYQITVPSNASTLIHLYYLKEGDLVKWWVSTALITGAQKGPAAQWCIYNRNYMVLPTTNFGIITELFPRT